MKYQIFALCKAWGRWPHEFYDLSFEEQLGILAFEDLRSEEERVGNDS